MLFHFTGCAIVQLPELLLFLYKKYKKLQEESTAQKTNTTIKTIADRRYLVHPNPCKEKEHGMITLDEIIKRVSKIEKDHIQLSKKVDGN